MCPLRGIESGDQVGQCFLLPVLAARMYCDTVCTPGASGEAVRKDEKHNGERE